MKDSIKFYSTNLKAEKVSFSEALLKGFASDGGLFMPEKIPSFTKKEIKSFTNKEYYQIAYEVAKKFLVGQINNDSLLAIVKDAYNYDVPLKKVIDICIDKCVQ